ncbi:hypothetical protein [Deinococcus marmoris]|uniref:hypothetical protein n=1 Tax=Deinococcus marmoris TaxID=249408 RepID=UPI000496ACC9|nr:hypothetical protein [Deinococcus marmoris]
MKVIRDSRLLLQPVIAVPVFRLPAEPAMPGNRVITQALVDGETCVIMGLESDRPATLAWLDSFEGAGTGGG